MIFDEFPTIYFNDIDSLIATARSNKVSTCLGIQDLSQLKKDYGADQSSVIMNIVGNIISGQVTGDTAKILADRFGKINQVKESISINRTDTSVSKSTQLDYAIPQSNISALSAGEFVGMVADDPKSRISLKTFHSEIINDHHGLENESKSYNDMPTTRQVSPTIVSQNYVRIKDDVSTLIEKEIDRIIMKAKT